ncbi:unnamed protein product [Cylicocyclus nassatus]|uniref:Mitochondrial ribosomal protein S14 n=1 Tax=Cylicocyclus nassatus TaxID=53992 RepID=A0AA36GHQ9_CYLNA|nr:unnamed protein product [Cylicocyclus nassatus]
MLRVLTNSQRLLLSAWKRTLSSKPPTAPTSSNPTSDVPEASTVNEAEPVEEQEKEFVPKHTEKYSAEAIAHLKLDQYPFYVEREWWKKGKRMTFWATWRQLRDVRRRELIHEVGADRMRLKALKCNTVLPQAIRDGAAEELFNMPKYSIPRLVLNMCMFTGRQRGKIKPYRLNRHLFRKLADHSKLSGVQRAMW